MSGENGAIAALADLGIDRKIFLHINNSNPAFAARFRRAQGRRTRRLASFPRMGWRSCFERDNRLFH